MNYLPILKSSTWAENANAHGVFTMPLVSSSVTNECPVIAYAQDQGDTLLYWQPNVDLQSEDIKAFKAAALEHLQQQLEPLDWSKVTVEKSGLVLRYLAFTGHFNAAESLLLPERLQQAHTLLNSERLLVCTPQRGMLLAFPENDTSELNVKTFFGVCEENYASGDNEPISSQIWLVENGVVKSCTQSATLPRDQLSRQTLSPTTIPSSELTIEPNKMYTPAQIFMMSLLGTFFAGLLAIASNYKSTNDLVKYKVTCFITPPVTLLGLLAFVYLPKMPYDGLFPFFAAFLVWLFAFIFQRHLIAEALNHGLSRQSIKRQVFSCSWRSFVDVGDIDRANSSAA